MNITKPNRERISVPANKILVSLFEKHKNKPWVLSGPEIKRKNQSFFSGKWGADAISQLGPFKFGLKSGIALTENCLILLSDSGKHTLWHIQMVSPKELKDMLRFDGPNKISFRYGLENFYLIELSTPESEFLQEFLDEFNDEVDNRYEKEIKEYAAAYEEKVKIENAKKNESWENKRRKIHEQLEEKQNSLLKEFDKDSNGVIDAIEGTDSFMKLFKKHQKKIMELDKDYIQKFVKISNYLKTKRKNIQDVFSSIKNTKNELQLGNNVGVLKNQIHTYELLLFHSLNMITSIVEDDLIVFYEIYESFDKLNMFNSNWENEVSQKLNNIGEGLNDLTNSIDSIGEGLNALMHSINSMEKNIVGGLNQLSYVTQEGFSELGDSVTRELQSIDSSIKFNNLLTGISTYQLYKINKQTKRGLIE